MPQRARLRTAAVTVLLVAALLVVACAYLVPTQAGASPGGVVVVLPSCPPGTCQARGDLDGGGLAR